MEKKEKILAQEYYRKDTFVFSLPFQQILAPYRPTPPFDRRTHHSLQEAPPNIPNLHRGARSFHFL